MEKKRKLLEVTLGNNDLTKLGLNLPKIDKVWTIYDKIYLLNQYNYNPETGVKIDIHNIDTWYLKHLKGAFFEERVHDWDISENIFKYHSKLLKKGESIQIIIEYSDTIDKVLDKNLLKQITMEDVNIDTCGNCDKETMAYYLPLPKDIQKHYEYLLENSDGTIDDKKWIKCVLFEYWINDNTFHYMFTFKDDIVDVTKDFNNEYLNNLILERYKKEYL